jgi:hypothetical protein
MADAAKPIAHPDNAQARHSEIARRYAWQAEQRRKRDDERPDQSRLITLIRLREMERLFKSRYGRFLPDDDAGIDDLTIAAHHVAFLRGEVIEHIVAWARAWAPWLRNPDAEGLAKRVAAQPRKWTADALAWRLHLSMTERTALKITTIGAFEMSKAEREAIQKERKRERERARRVKSSSGRPRGRPRKNACHAGIDTVAGHGFSPEISDAAREPPGISRAAVASTKENQISTFRAEGSQVLGLGKEPTAETISSTSRAASPHPDMSSGPPPEVFEKAVAMARDHHNSGLHFMREATRLIEKFWPGYVRGQIARGRHYYGRFDPERDLCRWDCEFRYVLDREYKARHLHLDRRSNWLRERRWLRELRERHDRQARYRSMTKEEIWRADKDRREQADRALAVRRRIAERRADRAVRDLYGSS